jgi:hypothetical protein
MKRLALGVCACLLVGVAGCASQSGEIDEIPPQRFLDVLGAGSEDEANAYYAANLPGVPLDYYQLARWEADVIGSRPARTIYYRNTNDLGFWREMECTLTIGRGDGGCVVTNWANEEDRTGGGQPLGAVAMDVSPDGYTRFYAFGPDGALSPTVVLDSEGEKALPRVCAECHAGSYDGSSSDMGSIFREFEPSLLQPPTGADPGEMEQEWFAFNQVVRSANEAVRGEAEGGPRGVDHAKSAENAYIDSIYAQTSPPVSRDVSDPLHLPPSWASGDDATRSLWTDVVARSCMPCHRTNRVDFSDYATFAPLGRGAGGRSQLELLTSSSAADHDKVPYMPQAEVTFDNLATGAIGTWLGGASRQ